MSRRHKRIMSEHFKDELAKELGFHDTVLQNGWGGITSKEAGNMVKRAVEIGQAQLLKQQNHS